MLGRRAHNGARHSHRHHGNYVIVTVRATKQCRSCASCMAHATSMHCSKRAAARGVAPARSVRHAAPTYHHDVACTQRQALACGSRGFVRGVHVHRRRARWRRGIAPRRSCPAHACRRRGSPPLPAGRSGSSCAGDTILRSALTSKPTALASRNLSRISPASAFFSSSSRSICSTSWRSCFWAETCSVVMDLPPLRNGIGSTPRATWRGQPSLPSPTCRTLAAACRSIKPPHQAIQRYLAEVFDMALRRP